jgi:hypothetical protein
VNLLRDFLCSLIRQRRILPGVRTLTRACCKIRINTHFRVLNAETVPNIGGL